MLIGLRILNGTDLVGVPALSSIPPPRQMAMDREADDLPECLYVHLPSWAYSSRFWIQNTLFITYLYTLCISYKNMHRSSFIWFLNIGV